MRRIAIVAASVLAFAAASVEVAAAADGCGRGRYWNGYRCAGGGGGGGGYYGGPQVYGGGGGYYGYQRAYRAPRVQGSVRCDYRGRCYAGGPLSCGHPGYTVQDGVCKPYRGY
jgi:hypothetical protein